FAAAFASPVVQDAPGAEEPVASATAPLPEGGLAQENLTPALRSPAPMGRAILQALQAAGEREAAAAAMRKPPLATAAAEPSGPPIRQAVWSAVASAPPLPPPEVAPPEPAAVTTWHTAGESQVPKPRAEEPRDAAPTEPVSPREAAAVPTPAPTLVSAPSVATPSAPLGIDTAPTALSEGAAPLATAPRPPAPVRHQVTIAVDDGSSEPTRIRVAVRGTAVSATILSPPDLAVQLVEHTAELQRTLEERGFHRAAVAVQTLGPPSGAAPRDGADTAAGRHGHRDEPPSREGHHRSATDDRPRDRRPDYREEE
ncbi:MAG: hypothetical protein HOP28_18465, partial [Gemmatimonadales bacterium]|nr:hypothetical protein [Gemmatimonadales bacterium]